MLLESMRLVSFQSFTDTGVISFKPGMNLLIGQNNVGKSALIRCLPFPLRDEKHRSNSKWRAFELQESKLDLRIRLTQAEMIEAGSRQRAVSLKAGLASTEQFKEVVKHVFQSPTLTVDLSRRAGTASQMPFPSHGLQQPTNSTGVASFQLLFEAGEIKSISRVLGDADSLPGMVDEIWQRSMFHFSAERMNVGEYAAVHATRLEPNAANLPAVLATMRGGRGSLFDRLVSHLRDIFPSTVGALSVQPLPSGATVNEVRVWPTTEQLDPDLSFALKESGTGVAQVTAILAAVMTVDHAVMVIDEINSFLHPAAVKTLLRILQTHYSQHQYIISTHSPEVISYANPSTVHLVKREGYESSIIEVDLHKVDEMRAVADLLGVSMSDVFAADRIIWVEGETEEICFPYVYREMIRPLPAGTIITKVAATGDFSAQSRERTMVYDIYKQLSTAAQPLVKGVVFSFDAEKLRADEMARMRADSKNAMHFLPRRLLECYLIDPEAIAAFINERDLTAREEDRALVTAEQVLAQLQTIASEGSLKIREWSGSINDEAWLKQVDGANLIDRTIGTVTEERVRFNKKGDALELLKSIMARQPERIRPLADYVDSLVNAVGAA
jgi:predicted ATPase